MDEKDIQQPPEPPDVARKLRIWNFQKVGMPIILLLPILGLSGLVDPHPSTKTQEGDAIAVKVDYPPRTRFGTDAKLDVRVKNTSDTVLGKVTVEFDTDYIERFSSEFKPEVERAYEVELKDVAPGEERLVSVDIKAQRIGPISGGVRVEADGHEPAQLSFNTFVLP